MDKVIELLKEVACNPDDFDLYKIAEEIRELIRNEHAEDLEMADNMRDYWKHQNSGAADWRG